MKRVFELLDSVAGSDANVLIVGESGTGKELAANALHAKSTRATGRMVKINCAALPKDLIESELFGHVKGAFTGASTDKAGLLEEAHKGSVLLDEITEMPMDLQAKLLRVLEDRQVRRLGGARTVPVDFRLICSTNRDPETAVREGQLRQDLYFRINTVTVTMPPLRERDRRTSRMLAKAFLERFATKHVRPVEGIDPEAYRRLLGYGGRATCASSSTPSSARCWWRAASEICLADLPESLRAEAPAARPRSQPRRDRSRRSSACPSCARSSRRAGTSRPPPRCWASGAPRSTRRCGGTAFRSAAAVDRPPADTPDACSRRHRCRSAARLSAKCSGLSTSSATRQLLIAC